MTETGIEQTGFLWQYGVSGDVIVADNQKHELNEQQILSFLQDIVGKIRTEEDPFELNKYRRLFRKAVPFTLRAYFAAYLLKQMDTGKPVTRIGSSGRNDRFQKNDRQDRARSGKNEGRQGAKEPKAEAKGRGGQKNSEIAGSDRRVEDGRRSEEGRRSEDGSRSEIGRNARQEKKRGESRQESRTEARESARNEPRVSLPEDLATTLFVSIGRNRRVYPRDIISLIMQNSGIEREHIGEIRVLDNYSFVQVLTVDAEKVIETLNEVEYRGRKLSVSHSRKRDEQNGSGSRDDSASTAESEALWSDSGAEDAIDSAGDASFDSADDAAENIALFGDSEPDGDDSFESDEGDADASEDKEE